MMAIPANNAKKTSMKAYTVSKKKVPAHAAGKTGPEKVSLKDRIIQVIQGGTHLAAVADDPNFCVIKFKPLAIEFNDSKTFKTETLKLASR
jgi:hypothetical protein